MSDKKSKRAENAEIVRAFSMLFQLGLSIMIPIALSIFIGYKLDRLFETGNILLLVFLFVGMAAGIRSVYVLTKSFYSKDFAIWLIALSLITSAIIMTIQSSIVVSLGMVGALSIVRFRTAIKDPMDLVFLFWSISVGIICGAGFAIVAVISSAVLTCGLLFLNWLPVAKASQILLVNSVSYEAEDTILQTVKSYCSIYKVKARNLTKDHLDMAIEVRVKEEGKLVTELMNKENITSASLVSHDGEVTF